MENWVLENGYGVRKRKFLSHSEKLEILKENEENGIPISVLARKHGIHPITVYQWKRTMKNQKEELSLEKLKEILAENEALKKENKNLKIKVADLSVGTDILKDALEIAKKKALLKQVSLEMSSKIQKNTKS